jgi:hypothetical protein
METLPEIVLLINQDGTSELLGPLCFSRGKFRGISTSTPFRRLVSVPRTAGEFVRMVMNESHSEFLAVSQGALTALELHFPAMLTAADHTILERHSPILGAEPPG